MTFAKAIGADELWIGEMRGISLGGRRVLLLRTETCVKAFEDRCAHLGIPLSDGKFEAGLITCRAHQYQYDACTGAGVRPECVRLRAFPVRVEDGAVFVDVNGVEMEARDER
jgi:toluene monooxygenase system ferredoxin subunit